jgi:hypothetical protein
MVLRIKRLLKASLFSKNFLEMTEGAMVSAKTKWLKDAEKNTKYFSI